MINTEQLFKETTYPTWIKTNPVFSKIKYIRKVFPEIGLPNFEEKIVIDNNKEIVTFANHLLDLILDCLHKRTIGLIDFSKKAKIGKKRKENITLLISVMSDLCKSLRSDKSSFILPMSSGKISLAIPNDLIYNKTVFMKKGTGLLKLYEKFNIALKKDKVLPLTDLTQTYHFKNYSSINIPAKETIVKFASTGSDGIWDIATMSMRGVSSCQTWDTSTATSGKVVGSMIDPFTAIIYLTCGSNYNHYGTKMVRRCVVRYVIDNANHEPYLLLERMYPAFDKPSLDTFISVIKKKNDKIPVLYSGELGEKVGLVTGSKLNSSYIPLSEELKMLPQTMYPYIDSHIPFKDDPSCKFTKDTTGLKINFKQKLPQFIKKTIASRTFKKDNVKPYGIDALKLVSQIRGSKAKSQIKQKELKTDDEFVQSLSNKFADFICDKSDTTDPFKYLNDHQKECASFFSSKLDMKINDDFANFVTSNLAEFIQKNNKL